MKYRFKKEDLGIFKEKEAAAASKLVQGGVTFGFTDGNFSLIDLIYNLLKKSGTSDIVIATWSAGIKDIHQVKWLMDTKLIKSVKIITDKSYPTRQKAYAASLEDIFGKENIRLSSIHSKFVLLKNENYKICIFSSMNLNANGNIENFMIAEGNELYDYVENFVNIHYADKHDGINVPYKVIQKRLVKIFDKTENKLKWWEQ